MNSIRTAIVGCGVISEVYAETLKSKFSIIELVACTDLDEKRMTDLAAKYQLRCMRWEDILVDKSIEMIINLTNPAIHYSLTKQALLASKHVFSEKMIATTLEEGKELCEIAKRCNVRLGVAPDTFLGSGIQTANGAISQGLMGKVLSGVISLSRDNNIFGEIIPHLHKKGGTMLYDMGCYYFTALVSILGNVKKISAFGKIEAAKRKSCRIGSPSFGTTIEVEDYNVITALLELESGAIVTVHLNSESILDETYEFLLFGNKGVLSLSNPNEFDGDVLLQKACNEAVVLPNTHGFKEQSRGVGAAEMAWAIKGQRAHRADMYMALHVLEIAQGITQSIEKGEVYSMTTTFEKPAPLQEGYIGNGFWGPVEESALI